MIAEHHFNRAGSDYIGWRHFWHDYLGQKLMRAFVHGQLTGREFEERCNYWAELYRLEASSNMLPGGDR